MSIQNTGGFISANNNPLTGTPATVEYMVVAGGGAGGNSADPFVQSSGAPGGGAGGLATATGYAVTPGSAITITVGAGGAINGTQPGAGANGSNSVFGSITATGGGGGAGGYATATTGGNGGSGGGGTNANAGSGAAGTGVSGQGFAGGTGSNNPGGGGGYCSAGQVGSGYSAGCGGLGLVTMFGGEKMGLAGGGGGGSYADISQTYIGQGGLASCGGGLGGQAIYASADSGQVSTGGGGGGGSTGGNYSRFYAGKGASGIVMIRYPATLNPPTSTTGGPLIRFAGGYQIYIWTSSGSVTF